MYNTDLIAGKIKTLKTKKKLSTTILSERSGLNKNTIISMLIGRNKNPTIKTLIKLANYFQVAITYFIE